MKRLCVLVVLMLAGSSAQAGTISFSVGGHRIRIEAPRGCSSSSCASISIPGVYESRKKRDDDTRNVATSPAPAPAAPAVQVAPPPAPVPPPVQQTAPVAPKPVIASVPAPAPLAVYKPAAVTTQEVAAPPPLPPVPQVQPAATFTQPCTAPPADKPSVGFPTTSSPAVLNVAHEQDPDSPLGDWETEGRGMVRIAECGRALCGYAFKEGEDEKGEAILINMKPKSDTQWSGSVYSKDSGDTYYGTMRLRGPNTLHVEACAFSRFYCNGNNWTRITSKPMMTSRQVTMEPRS
jgi:Uncharacterized protein conserved in bacteria (DUF2147)